MLSPGTPPPRTDPAACQLLPKSGPGQTGRSGKRIKGGKRKATAGVESGCAPRPDRARRRKLIDHMLRGIEPPPADWQKARIEKALNPLSTKNLKKISKAGVRFWYGDGMPEELSFVVSGTGNQLRGRQLAEYVPAARLIRLKQRTPTSQIRHEIAHAIDDLKDDPKGSKSIDKYKPNQRDDMVGKLVGFGSEKANIKLTTLVPDKTGKRWIKTEMSVRDMWSSRRPAIREQRFNSGTAKEGYSYKNPREFWAEGWAVFHGGNGTEQRKLLLNSPELFYALKFDAMKNGAPVPDERRLLFCP